jgi:outer membrane receptor protein involved in Fe transport
MSYRARLGWASPDSAWNITGFMNFFPHSFSNGTALSGNSNTGNGLALPPLCFLQGNPACSTYGPQFSQYTAQFPTLSNLVPGLYTFDLAVQYQTGDVPANRYLKNIGLTLAVNNILDKQPPFEYSVSTGSNTPHAFSNLISAYGTYITFTVTKAW